MKPNLPQLLDRIAALEKRIADLEARPASVIHYHYVHPQPCQPYVQYGQTWHSQYLGTGQIGHGYTVS